MKNTTAEYVPERQVAKLLGVSIQTLRRWRSIDSGPQFVKFGKSVRYSLGEVRAWATQQTVNVKRKKPVKRYRATPTAASHA